MKADSGNSLPKFDPDRDQGRWRNPLAEKDFGRHLRLPKDGKRIGSGTSRLLISSALFFLGQLQSLGLAAIFQRLLGESSPFGAAV
jgi:hypothetical protein